jgi:RNA polymerase sigma factor (sigma-70 family)
MSLPMLMEHTSPVTGRHHSTLPMALSSHALLAPVPSALEHVHAVPETQAERNALYAEFLPLVRRLMRQYGTEAGLREDLIGEIYFRFCTLLDAYDPERGIPLRPYLVRQLSASIYTFARHQWRRQKRETSLEALMIDHAEHPDPARLWDDNLTMEQVKKALPQAFARLSLRQRQVVVWRYYEDRSFEEIALRLNIQVATARSILRHGLNNIRRRLEESDVRLT